MVMPVRPEPVPPGQATMRPTPTPNGAEAGARHPLSDHQRDDTKAQHPVRAEGREAVMATYDRVPSPAEEGPKPEARLGERLDVYV